MDIQTIKITLMQRLLSIRKESVLKKISEILDEETIVGYTTDGKPLNPNNYNNRLKKAESQIKSGDYTSQDDLENESENW
jgi:hypothetical protein